MLSVRLLMNLNKVINKPTLCFNESEIVDKHVEFWDNRVLNQLSKGIKVPQKINVAY